MSGDDEFWCKWKIEEFEVEDPKRDFVCICVNEAEIVSENESLRWISTYRYSIEMDTIAARCFAFGGDKRIKTALL